MFAIYGWENRKLTRKSSLSLINKVNFRFSDRKSTRLNSSHLVISYAVFCLKKKKKLRTLVLAHAKLICATLHSVTNSSPLSSESCAPPTQSRQLIGFVRPIAHTPSTFASD